MLAEMKIHTKNNDVMLCALMHILRFLHYIFQLFSSFLVAFIPIQLLYISLNIVKQLIIPILPGMPVPIVIANVAMVSKEPHFGVYDRKENI